MNDSPSQEVTEMPTRFALVSTIVLIAAILAAGVVAFRGGGRDTATLRFGSAERVGKEV